MKQVANFTEFQLNDANIAYKMLL